MHAGYLGLKTYYVFGTIVSFSSKHIRYCKAFVLHCPLRQQAYILITFVQPLIKQCGQHRYLNTRAQLLPICLFNIGVQCKRNLYHPLKSLLAKCMRLLLGMSNVKRSFFIETSCSGDVYFAMLLYDVLFNFWG